MNPNKPDFNELPTNVQKDLLWDMELEYDGYEDSKPNCIHGILRGDVSSTNQLIIANYYAACSLQLIATRLVRFRDHARDEANRAQELINRLPDQS